VQGIEAEYHLDGGWWGFTYRGADFAVFNRLLVLPSTSELDTLVNTRVIEELAVEHLIA